MDVVWRRLVGCLVKILTAMGNWRLDNNNESTLCVCVCVCVCCCCLF